MKFLLGFAAGVLLLAGAVYAAAMQGWLPAAANDRSMRFEPFLADASVFPKAARQAPNKDVSAMGIADLLAGAEIYRNNCAMCHALPGLPQSPVGAGMFPKAPQLFSPDGMVTDDPAGETYWKVEHGMRLTGMPSFGATLSQEQIWDVTAVVKRADRLPPEVIEALKPDSRNQSSVPRAQ